MKIPSSSASRLCALLLFLFPGFVEAQKVNKVFDSLRIAVGFPGGTLSIKTDAYHLSMSTGYSDLENKIKMLPDDRLLLGSIGKMYVAAIVLQLVDENNLRLNDKVKKYLGNIEWYDRLPNSSHITIHHLLNHTSGIPEYVYAPEFWKKLNDQPDHVWTVEERLSYIFDNQSRFEVGEGWSYADANYIILGAIIEKVTGVSYYTNLQKRILQPFGLDNTSPSDHRNIAGLVPGYTGEIPLFGGLPVKMVQDGRYAVNPQFEWTGGGLTTTVSDLTMWMNLLIEDEAIIEKASLSLMKSPVNRGTGKPDNLGYGYGIEVWESSLGKAYGHSGFMPGYMSIVAYYPQKKIAIALQINIDNTNPMFDRRVSMYDLLRSIEQQLNKGD